MFRFSEASKLKLQGVDKRLVDIMKTAITNSPYDFKITCGVRSLSEQKRLFAQGKTKTLNSYHLRGKAVDIAIIVNKKITWNFELYKEVANHIKEAAKKLGYRITWGGDFKTFKDGVHFQIEE